MSEVPSERQENPPSLPAEAGGGLLPVPAGMPPVMSPGMFPPHGPGFHGPSFGGMPPPGGRVPPGHHSQPRGSMGPKKLPARPSPWKSHKSEDGEVYYYNTETDETTWDKPEGFVDPSEVESVVKDVEGTSWQEIHSADGVYFHNVDTKETTWDMPSTVSDAKLASARALAAIEAEQEDSDDEAEEELRRHEEQLRAQQAADEEAQMEAFEEAMLQEKVDVFRQMLIDLDVKPFASWEKELPRIVKDPRFKVFDRPSDRREQFENFSKTRHHELLKIRRAALDNLKELLAEHEFTHETTVDELAALYGPDPRWLACHIKDIEKYVSKLVDPLKEAETQRVEGIIRKAKQDYIALLREVGVHGDSRWSKTKPKIDQDKRYKLYAVAMLEEGGVQACEDAFRDHVDLLYEEERERRRKEHRHSDRYQNGRSDGRSRGVRDHRDSQRDYSDRGRDRDSRDKVRKDDRSGRHRGGGDDSDDNSYSHGKRSRVDRGDSPSRKRNRRSLSPR